MEVKERTKEQMQSKLDSMGDLNKANYLEEAFKIAQTYDLKNFILANLSDLYERRKMFDKAAKAMSVKARIEFNAKDKAESYLKAIELYIKAENLNNADYIYTNALRELNDLEGQKIRLAMKNLLFVNAEDLERRGKRTGATMLYEKLLRTGNLSLEEKKTIKEKLARTYKALGKFKEAQIVEGI
jgi:tetratricopeptide (TPR) repeat protein